MATASSLFSPDPWDLGKPGQIACANRRNQLLDIHSRKNFQRQRWPDAGSAEQKFKKVLFARGEKPVKRQRVFPHMRVDQKRHFSVEIAKRGESGERHGNQIPDTSHIEDDLVWPFFEQAPAQESDHRVRVLPLGRAGVNAGRTGTLFRMMRRGFVEQVDQ
jgi:hypothetical protein